MVLVRDVHESLQAEDTKTRHVQLVPAPHLLRVGVLEREWP